MREVREWGIAGLRECGTEGVGESGSERTQGRLFTSGLPAIPHSLLLPSPLTARSVSVELTIHPMTDADWPAVRDIYAEGIATGDATFETSVPDWNEWDRNHLSACRLVARGEGSDGVLGWVALSPVSSRCVYGGVAEVSVYIAARARGRGVGKRLLAALIEDSEREGLWTLQAGLFPENTASVAVHRQCGFREVGVRERIGEMNGVWRDDLLMERRSKTVAPAPYVANKVPGGFLTPETVSKVWVRCSL